MGEKDIAEKTLEGYNDVFADIVNGLLFNGRQVVDPDDLEDQLPRSMYKADGKIREMERDVVKRWKKQKHPDRLHRAGKPDKIRSIYGAADCRL